jgi:TolB-like protein
LKNLTGDPANDYFNDGMTESLINALSKIEGLKVISRGSVFSFRGKDVDPRAAGRLLGVAAVVEGGVRKDADSVRVTVRLVSTEDGRVLWASNTHDHALGDIFDLQDEIALGLAAGLRLPLTGEGARGLARRYTANVEAYQEYMRGRYWWDKRYREAFTKAIGHFDRAIALDPGYALAYAGIADCHLLLSPYGIAPPQEGYPKAKAVALKALEIDPLLVEAHVALAHLTWLYEWDWAKAERGFQRALELNPNDPAAIHRYSVFLSSKGRHDEAIAAALRARDLDPRSVTVSNDVMRAYYHARRYDEVIAASRHTLDIDPDAILPNSWLEMAYEQKGLYDESLAVRHRGMAAARVPAAEVAAREATYKSVGWQGYWRREITIMEARARQKYVMPYLFARIYARMGDRESALRWLDKAYAERADHLVLLNVDPLFDGLRSDPRFTALLTRVGFTL